MAATFLLAFVFQLVIGTVIGAIILRAACALFNKFVGEVPNAPESQQPSEFNVEDTSGYQAGDAANPFSAPTTSGAPPIKRESNKAIEEPSFGLAAGICLMAGLASGVVGIFAGAVGSQNPTMLAALNVLLLGVSFLIFAGLVKVFVRTTFAQAVCVALLFAAIGFVIGLFFAAIASFFLATNRIT